MKKIINISIAIILSIAAIKITIEEYLGYQFNKKYIEHSDRVQAKITEITGEPFFRKYSDEERINFKRFEILALSSIDFSNEICDIRNFDCAVKISKNKEVTQKTLDQHKDSIKVYEDLIKSGQLINTSMKTIETPIYGGDILPILNNLTNLRILSLLENGQYNIAKVLYSELHENKISHLRHANTIIYKMFMLSFLNNDIDLARFADTSHNLKLTPKELTQEDISIERAMDFEIEMALRLNPTLSSNVGVSFNSIDNYMKLNYINEISIQRYLNIIDYFNLSRADTENFKASGKTINPEFKPTFFEKNVAPIETILLGISTPDFSIYKDDLYEYNDNVENFNSIEKS